MRDVPHIWEAWYSTDPKIGDKKPCSRVTVEKSFSLRQSGQDEGQNPNVVVGTWNRGPARWYQRADTSRQIEVEVPNIKSVTIERSIDSDAGSCTLTLYNSLDLYYGEPEEAPGQYGRPGYFTWNRGGSQEAIARWGQSRNEWKDVFVPNALMRTYQGYGGHDKDIPTAVSDGNLVLTGVWLIDSVDVGTNGLLEFKCRDTAKLLIDQMLFPPLVPIGQYPLRYFRYVTELYQIPPESPPGPIHDIISQTANSLDGLGDYVDGPAITS